MERTLILLKPDAIQRGFVGEIISRFERKGLKLIGIKMLKVNSEKLQEHYAHLTDQPFYQDIENFMKSSPVIALALEGFECVNSVRLILGATNPREATAGTIRGDLAIGTGRNLVHASDSKENGVAEVKRFFEDTELFSYDKTEYSHLYEAHERA